jgi:hypothetical protein
VAEPLSKPKNTSVAGMVEAGADWDKATDPHLTAWKIVHQGGLFRETEE